jgi:predicted amidohydrolase
LIRIGLIQMRCEKAAMSENLPCTAHYYREAVKRGADIVGFPEMNITGYADPTRYPDAILRLDGPEVAQVLAMTHGQPATLLAGLIEANPPGKPFITQIVARDGQLVGLYRKTTIKDEEETWFSPGDGVPVFGDDGLTFGIAICADIGNQAVFAECARQGARIVFELAAPGLHGEQATRDWQAGFDWWQGKCQEHLAHYAEEYGYWIAVATQAGRTVDEDFPGGGYLFAPGGRRAYATPDWSPGAVHLQIDLETHDVSPL